MSGTSLDGVDLALCNIDDGGYSIVSATTIPYSREWMQRLSAVENASALEYVRTDVDLGHYYGRLVNDFLAGSGCGADAVASHGHTIFHQPDAHLTSQIGDGESIAAETGLPVVYNFRALDVALGGQGAPLVPVGDELFFADYDACLNLGGIANISYRLKEENGMWKAGTRVAFDICPCNMALNRLAQQMDLPFDRDGEIARRGLIDYYLAETLNRLDYYRMDAPKSLGKEWFLSTFWPVVEASSLSVVDRLRTVTEHIATHIGDVVKQNGVRSLLVTGGGAFNKFLVECICNNVPTVEITIPDASIVNYKEALVFALLGYLRLTGKTNILSAVTGARCDSIGGVVSGSPQGR